MKLAAVYIAVIASLAAYLVFGHNGILKYKEMVRVKGQYESQIKAMDERIEFLERELRLMKDSNAYMEYVIRRELGLQKSDEDQYIYDNAAIPSN